MPPVIFHADSYRKSETFRQTVPRTMVGLVCSGLRYMKIFDRAGELAVEPLTPDTPYLLLNPPGYTIDFAFGATRENWNIQCDWPELHETPEHSVASLQYGGAEYLLPVRCVVKSAALPELRDKFRMICELYRTGLPWERYRAEHLTALLAADFIREGGRKGGIPGAELLKKRLDDDDGFALTIAEHCRAAGLSAAHMRRIFREKYLLEPGAYRARLRMQKIFRLLSHSDLSFKEIADSVGMRNVTHLNIFLRRQLNLSPSELLRQFRE